MFKKLFTSTLLTLVAVGGFFVNLQFNDSIPGNHMFEVKIGIHQSFAKDCFPASDCNSTVDQSQNPEIQKMLNSLVAAINIALNILTIIVTPAIMLATWLMSPDWTAGDIFGLRPVLHDLWIIVSNITYVIYAILLIFIALATIFNSEHYGYKAMLPKLALGIIMVPLTWWAVQITVSLASYVTASAISIPAETIKKYTDKKEGWWITPSIPEVITYKNDKFTGNGTDSSSCSGTVKCLSPEDVVNKAGGMFSPLLIYSFAVFKIQDIKNIQTKTDIVTTIFSLIHQGIIGVMMFVIYGLLVLALIFMLLMRALKLWFYAIFSPLFTIKYVLGDKAFGDADKDGSMNITEFIGLAFVPAVVCLALSCGLVIISAMISPMSGNSNPDNKCEGTKCTIVLMGIPENTIVSEVIKKDGNDVSQTIVKIGGVSYTWEGSVSGSTPAVGGLKSALGATGNLFGTIIIDIIALVFIWIAFMAGKGVSKAASAAIAPFENMGKKIGELGMSLPKYAPIPGTGGLSMKSMERVPESLSTAISKNDNEKFEKSSLGKMLHAEVNFPPEAAKKLAEAIKGGDKDKIAQAMKDNQIYLSRERAYDTEIPKEFMEKVKSGGMDFLNKFQMTEDLKKKFMDFSHDNSKSGLNNDPQKKEFMGLIQSAFGSGAAGGSGPGANTNGLSSNSVENGKKVNINLNNKTLFSIDVENISNTKLSNLTPEQIKEIEANITEENMRSAINTTLSSEKQAELIDLFKTRNIKFKSPTQKSPGSAGGTGTSGAPH